MRWSNRYNIVAASYVFPGIDKVLSRKATQGFSVCGDVKHVHVSHHSIPGKGEFLPDID